MSTQSEVITFKADREVLERMKGLPNRSEFIRTAILRALENACPLCGGTGVLTPQQKRHWQDFEREHAIEECDDCHEVHLVCTRSRRKSHAHQASDA